EQLMPVFPFIQKLLGIFGFLISHVPVLAFRTVIARLVRSQICNCCLGRRYDFLMADVELSELIESIHSRTLACGCSQANSSARCRCQGVSFFAIDSLIKSRYDVAALRGVSMEDL